MTTTLVERRSRGVTATARRTVAGPGRPRRVASTRSANRPARGGYA